MPLSSLNWTTERTVCKNILQTKYFESIQDNLELDVLLCSICNRIKYYVPISLISNLLAFFPSLQNLPLWHSFMWHSNHILSKRMRLGKLIIIKHIRLFVLSRQKLLEGSWYTHICQQSRGGQIRKYWASVCDLGKTICLQRPTTATEVCLSKLIWAIANFITLGSALAMSSFPQDVYVIFDLKRLIDLHLSLPESFPQFFTNEKPSPSPLFFKESRCTEVMYSALCWFLC